MFIRQTSNHHHCDWHVQKPMYWDFQVISSSSSWSWTTLCILSNKYGFQIGNAMEIINYFELKEMLKMAWYSMYIGFWTCWFQWHSFWGCTFRCFPVVGYTYALSWKPLIIGLLLEYVETLLNILHLKNIAAKCSIFLHQLHFFSYWKVRDFWGDKDKISSREDKRKE